MSRLSSAGRPKRHSAAASADERWASSMYVTRSAGEAAPAVQSAVALGEISAARSKRAWAVSAPGVEAKGAAVRLHPRVTNANSSAERPSAPAPEEGRGGESVHGQVGAAGGDGQRE
jgi:hypothetical protein